MGTILTGYGDGGYDHEGYAAQVLDDGTITGTYSDQTRPRMIGQLVAACGCGWTGTTRYSTTSLFDEQAETLALGEWEHTHALPALEGDRRGRVTRLKDLLPGLAQALAATHGLGPEATGPLHRDRREVLERLLAVLGEATELARALREQDTTCTAEDPPPDGGPGVLVRYWPAVPR